MDQGWEIQDAFYRNLYNRAEHLLKTRNNTLHTRISYHYALHLLDAEGGDSPIVLPAILLHDIGYSQLPEKEIKDAFGPIIKKPELQRLHEIEGVSLAGKILREIQYPPDMIRSIQVLIDGHDTRQTAYDINDMIVKDADKLWRYSQEGFCLNYQWFDLRPKAYMERLLSHIPIWFFTQTARKLATEAVQKLKAEHLGLSLKHRAAEK